MTVPPTLSIDVALQQALNCRQAGLLQEAERLFRAILQAQPNNPEANYNLGLMAVQENQPAAGLSHFKAALEANPNYERCRLSYIDLLIQADNKDAARKLLAQGRQRGLAGAEVEALAARLASSRKTVKHSGATKQIPSVSRSAKKNSPAPSGQEINELTVLFSAGHYVEMEKRARLLLERYPNSGVALKMLGASLQMQGKNALPALEKATELLPDDASAHYNLGNALLALGRLDGVVASCRRALKIEPNYAKAHNNLGSALLGLGQLDDAVASYRRALKIEPVYAEAHNNLGNALQDLGQIDEAAASYAQALEIKPDFAEALNNLGLVLQNLGQRDDAVASYVQALVIEPNFAEAHSNLGNALKDIGKLDDAVASHLRALEINPDFAEAHHNLGIALLESDQLDSATASYRRALEIKPDFAQAHSSLLFTNNYLANQPLAEMLVEARRFGELVARQSTPHTIWHNAPNPARSLRVGFVSGDLRNHPVGYFLESLLPHIAPTRVELSAYPANRNEDELTARIKTNFTAWKPLAGLGDKAAASLIHADCIDILVDLSGHTANNRLPLFAWKPAPIQVSWLGYFATTGVSAMDYLIADPWTLPETEETHFTEKIWRLPETRLCFTPPDADVSVSPLPALDYGYVTFGCFNNLTKMNDVVVALWARVLQAAPRSRLFLKTKQLGEDTVRQRTIARFAAHGISADRLTLEGYSPRAEYLAAYRRVDITLDPFPYPGGTTSVESLWMGVPVLTLAGERFLSRQGVGLLMNTGLPEWIATDADDYVARAALHTNDLQRLAALRDGLRQQVLVSPLFDAQRFAHHFEAALHGMWRKWCASRMA